MTSRPDIVPPTAADSSSLRDADAVLTDLVGTLMDGVRGYETAAEKVDNPAISAVLTARATQRRQVVDDVVRSASDAGALGVDFDVDGTAPGAVHRAWIAVESAVAGDNAVVKSALNGEDHALDECNDALQAGLPEGVNVAIRAAVADITEAMQALEELEV